LKKRLDDEGYSREEEDAFAQELNEHLRRMAKQEIEDQTNADERFKEQFLEGFKAGKFD